MARFEYRDHPRAAWIEDRCNITWCNAYHAPAIGLRYAQGFDSFTFLENALLPFNRNGVLSPRKIRDKCVLLSRPSRTEDTPFGDIYLRRSPDLIHRVEHRFVMDPAGGRQSTKIGAGPIPLGTAPG